MRIVDQAWQDLRYAARSLLRAPGFVLVVLLILSIGIGVNGAVLGIIDNAFFRRVPVPSPEGLVGIGSGDKQDLQQHTVTRRMSLPAYRDMAARVEGLEGLAAYGRWHVSFGGDLSGTGADAALVTGNYFQVLRAEPARGRVIGVDEEQPMGAHAVVVISDWLWRQRFAADESILGREVVIGGGRFTIVGVMPPGFTGVNPEGRTDLWLPYTMQPEATERGFAFASREARLVSPIGRLAAGATISQVQASLDRAASAVSQMYPATDGSIVFQAFRHDNLAPIERSLWAFVNFAMAWAMIVLLHVVACTNVATLMLARAAARRREVGIRLCLGASPRRILREALTEPMLLAVLGTMGGLVVARFVTRGITSVWFLSALDPGLDGRAVAIVAFTAVASLLVCGWLPARTASRGDPATVLQGSSGSRVAGVRGDATPLLIAGQMAVSLVLLVNAGVFYRAFDRQASGDAGFEKLRLAVVSVTTRERSGPIRDWNGLHELVERVARIPGVRGVAASMGAPLLHAGQQRDEVIVTGHEYAEGEGTLISAQAVGPGYFSTLGSRLVSGREFTDDDRGRIAQDAGFSVAIVNEAMVRRYWPDGNALGRRLADRKMGSATVVGVVRDLHDVILSATVPRVYFPLEEWRLNPAFELVVRTEGEPATVRGAIYSAAADAPLLSGAPTVRTMSEIVNDALATSRIGSIGLALCGVVALLLTVVGLYGLVASWALQRRMEIGIRLALGAERGDINRLLLRGAAIMVGAGSAAGIVAAIAMLRLERAWWGPFITIEAAPVIGAVGLLAAVAGLAAWLPSRRASTTNPAEILQSQ